MAGVTPRQIYTALIGAGATQVQAIGIMANMIAESRLNPEAVGDGGTSFGLVQQHGAQYASLVTGNPTADMNAQIRVIALNKGFAAASGATAGQAAGNFSANYERCTTCQPGQASYNARVANAGVVAGWVSSGKWPATAPASAAGTASGSSSSSSSNGSSDATCAWSLAKINLHVTTVGGGCLVHKSTLRHLAGGALIVAGGLVALPGVLVLAAFAFRQSGAQQAAAGTLSTLGPYGRGANRVIMAPTNRAEGRRRAAATAQRQQAVQQRRTASAQRAEVRQGSSQARRAAGSQAQQRRAVSGQAPRRRAIAPPAQQRAPRAEHHE